MSAPEETHRQSRARFFERLAQDRAEAPSGLIGDALLAVGYLIGSDLPGAAAAVAVLLERAHPDDDWPWTEPEPEEPEGEPLRPRGYDNDEAGR